MRRIGSSRQFRRLFASLAMGASLVLCAGTARAEWLLDAFVGIPFPRGGEVTADRVAANSFPADVDEDLDVTFGLRFGRYAEVAPWLDLGLALDASGTLGEIGNVDFNFVPVTGLLLARVPLFKSEELPHGMIQPYIGGGASLVWSQLAQNSFNDNSLDGGAAAVGGIKFMFMENFGIFAEYRFNYFTSRYQSSPYPLNQLGHVDVKSLSHTPTIGASWHFSLPWD